MQTTVGVKRRLVVSAMPTIICTEYYKSFAVADVRSVLEEVGRNCKHTRGRFAHPVGRRKSRRPTAGGVNNMRRVARFCACCNRSPTSLASFAAIAILAQAIGSHFELSRSPRAIPAYSSAIGACGPPDYDVCIVKSGKERNPCTRALQSTGTTHTNLRPRSAVSCFSHKA